MRDFAGSAFLGKKALPAPLFKKLKIDFFILSDNYELRIANYALFIMHFYKDCVAIFRSR